MLPSHPNVLTISADNGKEFAGHIRNVEILGTDFFFAEPCSCWERGLNEHTNGRVRECFPKRSDFHEISEAYVDSVQNLLNEHPSKVLGYLTPAERLLRKL